jgi:hypothetical protein
MAETLSRVYTEDFTSLQYCDTVNTTAWWDTAAGEIKMLPFELTSAGEYDTPSYSWGVAVAGDYAYVADGSSGLLVFDISDPANPDSAGAYDSPGFARAVWVSGDYAFVADASWGLQVVDISDPTNPLSAGGYNTPSTAYGVTVSGDYAYLANADLGLYVFDISDPTSPAFAGFYDTPGTSYDVAISGDYAFVADGPEGLIVIDITDPTSPDSAGTCDTPGTAIGVAVAGDNLFMADTGEGLRVIDISDPANPASIGSYDTPGSAYGLSISGNYAYVADANSGLQVVSIFDPANPELLYGLDTPGSARGVEVSGAYAFVADYDRGLQVVDIADPIFPPHPITCSTAGITRHVALSGDYAYVANGRQGLAVVDITNPGAPTIAGSIETPDLARWVAVSGNYAYVAAEDSGLQVMDISDPTTPTLAGTYNTPRMSVGVALSGDYAYAIDSDSGLVVIDISDPTTPTLAGGCVLTGSENEIVISGDYAYVAVGYTGLHVLDISDPTNPAYMVTLPTSGEFISIAVSGDYAYIVDEDGYLAVIDISDPISPMAAGTCEIPTRPQGIAISGDYAYITDDYSFLHFVDISDPTTPEILGSCYVGGYAPRAVAVSGDYAYIAHYTTGLSVLGVFQRRFDDGSSTAQSLPVNEHEELIASMRVTSTQSDTVRWYLSAEGGDHWQEFSPGGPYQPLSYPGSRLVWRSRHVPLPWQPETNPTCTSLQIEWLYQFAMIDNIVDVPGDQGGWAYVYFTRSGYDIAGALPYPVEEYFVFRRIDGTPLGDPAGEEEVVADNDLDMSAAAGESMHLPPWVNVRDLICYDGDYYVKSDGTDQVGLPPGTWAVVGSVPAHQEDQYVCLVPTIADSSAELTYSVYCISAETTNPTWYYISLPDSGYSIDNLAPSPPPGLTMPSATDLDWEGCPDSDFNYFTVYGSAAAELDSSAALLGYTIDTAMDVTGDVYDYYHVTATDFAGNEGDASSVANTFAGVLAGEDLPQIFALRPNRPNPFESETLIGFDLPEPCAVRLEVVDVQGRVVRVLADGAWPAGRHALTWAGEGDDGVVAGPGVYFVRMKAGSFTDVSKMLLMR